MSTPLSSAELNLLVYRYLLESGFDHAAYVFGYQSLVHKHTVKDREIPPAALISFVQKGVQYLELEANLTEDSHAIAGDLSSLSTREILTRSTAELRSLVQERREKRELERLEYRERLNQIAEDGNRFIKEHQVRILEGHQGEVFCCNWSPAERDLLATSASDKTARIWRIGPNECSAIELNHSQLKDKDVTIADWSPDGNLLATGTQDGIVQIWSKEGVLQQTLDWHAAPIFALKWSRKSEFLLTGSLDKTAAVWSARTGLQKQHFYHSSYCFDVDWRSNNMYATCSADKTIKVCKVGEDAPLKSFHGHTKDINAIKWDPQGNLLASGSDDGTARIWSLSSETSIQVLRGHDKEIYCLTWAPVPIENLTAEPVTLLATGSFDTTIRLWDPETGMCAGVLSGHTEPVYSLAFSPDGKFLASGSFDHMLQVWSIPEGKLVRSYKHTGGLFDVSWNLTGDRLAACAENKVVIVIDLNA